MDGNLVVADVSSAVLALSDRGSRSVSLLTLEIEPAGGSLGWTVTWWREGELLGEPMAIGGDLAETSR